MYSHFYKFYNPSLKFQTKKLMPLNPLSVLSLTLLILQNLKFLLLLDTSSFESFKTKRRHKDKKFNIFKKRNFKIFFI